MSAALTALITCPSEEPSNAQSQHVQDQIGSRLSAGGSNAKAEHDVSCALLPGNVLTFYLRSPERGDAQLVPVRLDRQHQPVHLNI
jgi:hypothetical protein